MRKIFTLMLSLAALMPAVAGELSKYDANKPIGWAAVGKTTGSKDQNEVTAKTFTEFKNALNSKTRPLTIYIDGEITMEKRLYV